MPPAAVLRVLVQVGGVMAGNRELMSVHATLGRVEGRAQAALDAVDDFGRTRATAHIDVRDDATGKVAIAAGQLKLFDSTTATAELDANTVAAAAATGRVQDAVDDFGRARATAHIDLKDDVTAKAATATAEIRKIDGLTATARADLKISGAEAQIDILNTRLAQLADQDPTVEVRVQIAKALADLERVEAKHRDLTAPHPPVKVDIVTNRARQELQQVGTQATIASRLLAAVSDGARKGGGGVNAMRGSLGPLSGGLGALSSVSLFLAAALLGIVGPAIAVASSLTALVGLFAAAGGAAAAGAQGFGVFKLATMGVLDALKEQVSAQGALGASSANLNEKFDKLPASAQRFVRVLIGMKDKADELRATAADGFFPGAEQGLIAAARNFEPVKKVVGETAVELGTLARRSGELVGSSAFGSDIVTVGHSNVQVMDSLGNASLSIVDAFRHVLVVAGPLTRWLANLAEEWAANAAESAKAGRESGKMADFFERTRAVLERVGSIVGHVARGLFGLGKTGSESGDEILESIDKAAKRFDEWANSAKGQADLKQFFKDTKELAGALGEVIGNLTKGFGILTLRLLPVVAALKLLGPYADEAVIAFLAYKVALTGVNVAQGIYNVLTTEGMRRAIAWRAALLLAAAQTVITAGVMGGLSTAFWALNAAMDANPIGLVIIALAALAAGLIYAYKHSETFRDIINTVWGALKDGFGWVKDHWPLLLAILTGPFGLAVYAIAKNADDIVGFFKALPGRVVGALEAVPQLLIGAGGWLINRIVDGLKATVGTLLEAGGWVKNRIVDGVHAAIDGFVALGGWALNRVVDGFKVVGEALGSVGGWLKNRVVELVQGAADGFVGVGGWILNRVVEGFKVVTDGLSSVGGWLKNRVSEAFDAVKDGFLSVGGSIIGWIVDGLKKGANKLVDFVNDIIHIINKIPGVDIGDVKGFAQGGVNTSSGGPNGNGRLATAGMAAGGAFGLTGGYINAPITMMGEEAPRFGEFVIPTNPAYRGRAQMLLAQAAGAIGLKSGGIVGSVAGAVGSAAGAVGGAASSIAGLIGKGASALIGALPGVGDLPDWIKGTGKYVLDKVGDWIKSKIGLGGGGSSGAPGGPVPAGDVRAWLTKALNITGNFSAANLAALYGRTMQESGGNPHAINLWDSNAAAGHPSKGLLQTIDSTFNQYKLPKHGDIWDPVDNAIAAIRYMLATYGHIVGPSDHGYARGGVFGGLLGSFKDGTDYVPRTGAYELHQGERVTPAGESSPEDLVAQLLAALAELDVTLKIGDEVVDERVEVVLGRKDRKDMGTWRGKR